MAYIECNRCGRKYSDKMQACPFCKNDDTSDKNASQMFKSAKTTDTRNIIYANKTDKNKPLSMEKATKRYVSPIIVVSIVLALCICFFGFQFYQKIQRENATREFSIVVSGLSGKLITLAITAEKVVDDINEAWRDAIFSKYDKRDFNEAIHSTRMIREKEIESIEKMTTELGQEIRTITPPEGKEKDYQRVKEIYLLFNKYAEMAISPSGSLQTYSEQNNTLTVEIKSAIKELELMK